MKAKTITYKGETHPLSNVKFIDPVVNAIGHIVSFHTQTSKSGATFLKVERSILDRIEYLTAEDNEWANLGWERSNDAEIEALKTAHKQLHIMLPLFEIDAALNQSGMTLVIDMFGRVTRINLMDRVCTLDIATIETMINEHNSTIEHA